MYRIALRAASRRIASPNTVCRSSSRFISTAPPAKKSRGWKSSAARWGLAIGGVYYYNTSNVFAEEPEATLQKLDESIHQVQESSLPTVDALVEEKRRRQAEQAAEEQRRQLQAEAAKAAEEEAEDEEAGEEGLGGLEEEAGQQGAFNPETGEINWDCPCLGGMAHGPCGEEFKEAFSCFVYSKEEPKGVECIEKFKGMQDCFRLHPEMYGSELEDDEEMVEEELQARESAPVSGDVPTTTSEPSTQVSPEVASKTTEETTEKLKPTEESHHDSQTTTVEVAQNLGSERGEVLPKVVHETTK